MRGLLKAAALLSFFSGSASSVPRSLPVQYDEALDFVLKYNESEASVVFRVSEPIAPGVSLPPIQLRVGSTKEPCGESNLSLDGQELNTEWDESRGIGSDFLVAFRFLPNIFVSWHISCIPGTASSNQAGFNGVAPVQVARFGIYNHNEGRTEAAGFAVSFLSSKKPELLRVVPAWTDNSDILAYPERWRSSSMPITIQPPLPDQENGVIASKESPHTDHDQKTLKAHLEHLQSFLGTSFQKARETFQSWCPSNKQTTLGATHDNAPSPVQHDAATTTTTTENDMGTNPHALPTRSASPELATTISTSEQSDYTGLKVFGMILILSSLLIWITLRLRDPRLRADRAARREERRNKRLYRQAAWQQKWKRWFCSWRHRDHRCTPISTWDEKRARVLVQEEVLEQVMKQDIRKLKNVRNRENNVSAAEQGRSVYIYDSDDLRRRSRETLPGYESEGTQPPSYDVDVNGDVLRVAAGFRYNPADRDDTPDSSVISTSPRTSRDDRSSIYEKEIEPLSLSVTKINV